MTDRSIRTSKIDQDQRPRGPSIDRIGLCRPDSAADGVRFVVSSVLGAPSTASIRRLRPHTRALAFESPTSNPTDFVSAFRGHTRARQARARAFRSWSHTPPCFTCTESTHRGPAPAWAVCERRAEAGPAGERRGGGGRQTQPQTPARARVCECCWRRSVKYIPPIPRQPPCLRSRCRIW